MYIRIPPFQEGKRKFVPPKKEGPTAYSVIDSTLQTEYTISAGALSTQTPGDHSLKALCIHEVQPFYFSFRLHQSNH